jgi:hypothetical protein
MLSLRHSIVNDEGRAFELYNRIVSMTYVNKTVLPLLSLVEFRIGRVRHNIIKY